MKGRMLRFPDEASIRNRSAVTDPQYWSRALADQIRHAGLPAPVLEYPFAKSLGRKFAADLAWPSMMKLCEVDGAAHRIKERFAADIERDQIILQLGFTKLRVSPRQVRSGDALTLVRRFLQGEGAHGVPEQQPPG